ncbi:MAG TPA: ester cyclase [Solirubrobacteraceae bacterium]|nr:ester cyclase [Solirubrobacteraceae bacterium]
MTPVPGDRALSVAAKGSTRRWLHPDRDTDPGHPNQAMRGFDPGYADIVDWIMRITHRIWEEKDIGHIYDTYRHNAVVTDDAGVQYGRDKIVADTVHTIAAFPDVRLYADEIVWAGDEDEGFHTSHRTVIVGHNTGFSRWAAPTGRRVVVWAIANCRAVENEIVEEHVLYNTSSLLSQLGFDLRALAREAAAGGEPPEIDDVCFGEPERLRGQGPPAPLPALPDDGFQLEPFLRRLYDEIWNWRNLGAIDRAYAPGIRYLGAGNRRLYGRGDLKALILTIMAMLPDLVMQIDDLYWMGDERTGHLAAVRWSIVGTHRGHGPWGAPTGRRVHLWGISQHELRDGRIAEEWTVFNEFDVLRQLARA